MILAASFPSELATEITTAYQELGKKVSQLNDFAVAVRSSATAEDLPNASFAGES